MTRLVLEMSLPTARERQRFLGSRASRTLVGMAAIPLWATWPLLATLSREVPASASQLPTFELLAIAFGTGAALLYACDRSKPAIQRPTRGLMADLGCLLPVPALRGREREQRPRYWLCGIACHRCSLHLVLETTVIPSTASLAFAQLIGVLPLARGALAWDHGIRRGDRRTLAILAYATPLASALILILCGYSTPSIGLVLGGGLIVAAGAVSASRQG